MRQSDLGREAEGQVMRDQVDKVCKVGRRGGDMSWRDILSNVSLKRQERKASVPTIQVSQVSDGYPPNYVDIFSSSPPLPLSLL